MRSLPILYYTLISLKSNYVRNTGLDSPSVVYKFLIPRVILYLTEWILTSWSIKLSRLNSYSVLEEKHGVDSAEIEAGSGPLGLSLLAVLGRTD